MWYQIYSQFNNFLTFRELFSVDKMFVFFRRVPLTINLLITMNCNLQCSICSVRNLPSNKNELNLEQLNAFFKTIYKYKPVIFLGGGEPFARGDIFKVIELFNKYNLKYGMVTNGTFLNSEKISRLIKMRPKVLVFSVFGNRNIHDKIVGKNGVFDVLYQNINRIVAVKKNIKVIINCVINEDNYRYLEDIIKIGKDLRVDRVRFEHLSFITKNEYQTHVDICRNKFFHDEGDVFTHGQNIREQGMGEMVSETFKVLQAKNGRFVQFKPFLSDLEIKKWYSDGFKINKQANRKCFFIHHSVFVKNDGDVIPCQFYPNYILGNIRKDYLLSIFNNKKHRYFKSVVGATLLPGCMRCCKL